MITNQNFHNSAKITNIFENEMVENYFLQNQLILLYIWPDEDIKDS